jgi:endonuclease/exonuclease/phosphatase family metal-dependent hydrolase
MNVVADVSARPPFGVELGRVVTELNHGLFRSLFTGQGNAVLFARSLRVVDHETIVLNPPAFRRREGRALRLGPVAQLAWARERRICQAARVRRSSGETLLVANVHATSYPADPRLADVELLRAATFADALAGADEPLVLAGDFNVSLARSQTLRELASEEWGLTGATHVGIDHVLVRGLAAGPPTVWPASRRTTGHGVLADHAPVDREIA